ncbi:MAG: phosphate uptake regulator PhoU [Nitrososphaerota archaeon]
MRRLQKVGAGTLTVSLPSRWVRAMGLAKGDVVEILEMPDGGLRVSTEGRAGGKRTAVTLDAAKFTDKDLLSRLVVGAYLQGSEEIRIISGEGLSGELQASVTEVLDMLPGVEVVEQTYRRVVIQSFVDPRRFPVEALIKRIQVMLTTIINNLAEAARTGRRELLHDIERIENKLDELYFLCVRQIFIDVKTKSHGEAAPENYLTAIGDRLVVRALEEMADSVKMAAGELMILEQVNVDEHLRRRIAKLIEPIQVLLGKTMKAFFSLDASLANEVIETTRKEFGGHISYSELFSAGNNDATLAIILRNIVWDMISVARNCKIIAEVTLNRFVRTPSKLVELEIF